MSIPIDNLIRSLDIPVLRDYDRENKWSYQNYSAQILEAIQYHCNEHYVSEYMKYQISRMMHQGYVVIGNIPFASPVRSIYETLERVTKHDTCRGVLNNISEKVGLEVLHTHFAHASCITENWVNHTRKTKLEEKKVTAETVYESLISSLSKAKKTGEWIVYSKSKDGIKFWCIWLHSASDEELIEVIKSQCA